MSDIKREIKTVFSHYSRSLEIFKNNLVQNNFPEKAKPIEWLERYPALIKEIDNFIEPNQGVKDNIIVNYWKLDEKIGENGKEAKPINQDQLAQLLNCSKERALEICLRTEKIGIYIKNQFKESVKKNDYKSFDDERYNSPDSLKKPKYRTVSEVESAINEGIIDIGYPYDYQGYSRLIKKGAAAYRDKQAIHACEGGKINLRASETIKLQSSFYDYVIGIEKYIISTKNIEISSDDFIFMEDEVIKYADFSKKIGEFGKFNWNDFYFDENRRIIEKLLDDEFSTLDEISEIFFPAHASSVHDDYFTNFNAGLGNYKHVLEHFRSKFRSWEHEKGRIGYMLKTESEENKWHVNLPWLLLNSHTLLTILINDKFLPTEIYRLPTLMQDNQDNKKGNGGMKDHDIKEISRKLYNKWKNEKLTVEEIIKSPENYGDREPTTLTFMELQERWKSKGFSPIESLIWKGVDERKIGIYFRVPDSEDIFSSEINSNDFHN
ncbi:MAG: hypothetical protein ACHQUC_09010, partial [Chlamydiales bacterium]